MFVRFFTAQNSASVNFKKEIPKFELFIALYNELVALIWICWYPFIGDIEFEIKALVIGQFSLYFTQILLIEEFDPHYISSLAQLSGDVTRE